MSQKRWEEIQSLFAEVVDLEPPNRAERLAVISETDPELYSEVLSLLDAHAEADDRLDRLEEIPSPGDRADVEAHPERAVSDPYGLVGRTVSHYQILEPLGGGGMGLLYKAADTRLERVVALKFLPPQWSLDAGFKERFEHEARAAAALDHPNICTIHEVGETEEGQLFIAMAYYEGETVKEKLARGPLEIDEAVNVARQAASGLAAAHERGIVHRDIKPANLIVTGDGDSALKILDFGLAKTVDTALTETGMRLGTPAYMSPEQTRGGAITPATDLWSLGAVLYEMLTGQRPFRADNDRAVISAIRHDEPEPPSQLRKQIPADLQSVVLGLLSKEPSARQPGTEWLLERPSAGVEQWLGEIHRRSLWQVLLGWAVASWVIYVLAGSLAHSVGLPHWFGRAAMLVLALGLPVLLLTAFVQPRGRTTAGIASQRPGIRRILTWRNAVLGGVSAFALLGIGTAGYMAMRGLGFGPAATLIARGVLEEREPLILAEFEGPDSALARTVTEALRMDLSGSEAVQLISQRDLSDALGRMQRDPTGRLPFDIAREVAIRDGIKGVIGGTISTAGDSYVLTARLVSAEEGQILIPLRETAEGASEVVPAIDRLSRGIRERIGESLKSLNASPRLVTFTTPSLQALEKFTAGRTAQEQHGDAVRALDLYEEAVRLDTTFAAAWRKIAITSQNRARQIEAATKAFHFRNRAREIEALWIEATYYTRIAGDWKKALAAYDRVSELQGGRLHINVGFSYWILGDYEAADSVWTAIFLTYPPTCWQCADNIIDVRIVRGRLETVDSLIGEAERRLPGFPLWKSHEAQLAAARGHYAEAATHYAQLRAAAPDNARASVGLAGLATLQGDRAGTIAETDSVLKLDRQQGLAGDYVRDVARFASALHLVWGDTEGALEAVSDALRAFPLDSIPTHDRPYLELAWLYAAAGLSAEARHRLADYERGIEPKHFGREVFRHRALAELALAESDPRAAIREIDRARQLPHGACRPRCTLPLLGRAYEMLQERDSAIAAYEGYAQASRGWSYSGPQWDALYLAHIYESLGQLYDERGDSEKAADYYARFVELWKDADPELQPRVEAAQLRLNDIMAERG